MRNTILGVAALLCLFLAIFNVVMSYPAGIPPEFPLFLVLTFIFAMLWLFTRPGAIGKQ